MSYFFGSADNNRSLKVTRGKHCCRNLFNDKHIENQRKKHHRKYSSTRKYIFKPKYFIKGSLTSHYNGKALSLKNRSKYCLQKMQKTELNQDNVSAVSAIKKKDKRDFFHLRKKYKILKQRYCEIQSEHEKVNILLAQQEIELRHLHEHFDKSALIIKSYEQKLNNFVTAIQIIKNEKFEQHKDVILLKNLVYRLNAEIEKYQDKLNIVDQKTDNEALKFVIDKVEGNYNTKNILKIWNKVDFHALGPLLDSYQENVNEKNELINKYQLELGYFNRKIMAILIENQNLHDEITNSKEQRDKCIYNIKFAKADVAIAQEQNNLFCKQISIQKKKIQEIHSIYQQNVKLISEHNSKLQKDYLACKTELSNLNFKYEFLNESYKELQINLKNTIPMSTHKTAVEECNRLFEKLKQQYESEKKKLNICIKHSVKKQPEKEKQLIMVTEERNKLGIQVQNLEKKLKQEQHKLQYLRDVIHSIRLSRTSFEQQLNKTAIYCEELAKNQERLIKEKDIESKVIQSLGSIITHRMKTLKSQLMIVQQEGKEQLSLVKKYAKTQEFYIHQMKTEFQREITYFKELLHQKEETIKSLQREKFTIQENIEFFWKTVTCDGKEVKTVLKPINVYSI